MLQPSRTLKFKRVGFATLCFVASLVLFLNVLLLAGPPGQKTFASPEAARQALFAAARAGDPAAMLAAGGQSEGEKKPEQFSATAFGQGGMFAGKSASLNIYITDYTSDQEVEELAATLKTKGSDALLRTLQKMKEKGRVATTGRVGWTVPIVRQHTTEKGRRVVMFADRPISFYEASTAPRSRSYEFGMLVLDVNNRGEGEGLLYGACKVKFTKDDQLQVEHYDQAPARLSSVKLWQ
jgi:hypothetical protein